MGRHQCRLLLLRTYRLSHPSSSSCFQVISNSLPSLSSFLDLRYGAGAMEQPGRSLTLQSLFTSSVSFVKPCRNFSSESAIQEKPSDDAAVIEIFSRLSENDAIRRELKSSGVVISHDLGLKVLKGLESNPEAAKRFFQWVLKADARKLSSKSYNSMLRILGVNGFVDEFWGLVETMKKKGYSVSGHVRDKVGEKFKKDGQEDDLDRLKELFSSGSIDNSADKVCHRVCKIVMKEDWGADMEKRLRDLNIEFRSDLVKKVLEKLDMEPRKGLLFFRWVHEFGLFKHDADTYNAMARVLGREKFIDGFRNLIEEMRKAGHEMEMETYVRVSGRFCQTNMIEEAVELFEFAMGGTNTPTPHCCTLLLKKIVTAADKLDMDLLSRVLKVYTFNGNALTDSMLNSILRSLKTVGRFDQTEKVVKAMKGEDYVCSGDRKSKRDELKHFMEASGSENLDDKALAALVEGHCNGGELEEAAKWFGQMVRKEETSYVGYSFEKLVLAYCNKSQAKDAYELLVEYVKETRFKPWYSTYRILVRNLLMKKTADDGGFEQALSLLRMMRGHGFSPFTDPFVDYVSKHGTSDESLAFLEGTTSKKFPSIALVLRVFEAMVKNGRHKEAHELLSLCPKYIRSHSDIIRLFDSLKPVVELNVQQPLPLASS